MAIFCLFFLRILLSEEAKENSKFSMAFCSCSSCELALVLGSNETILVLFWWLISAQGKIIASVNIPFSSTVNLLGIIPFFISTSLNVSGLINCMLMFELRALNSSKNCCVSICNRLNSAGKLPFKYTLINVFLSRDETIDFVVSVSVYRLSLVMSKRL